EDDARVLRVHRQARAAGVFVDEEHAIPMLSAVSGPEHAALLLRRRQTTSCADQDDLGIRGVNDDAADAPRLVEAGVRPRLAGINGLVDAIANAGAVADRPGLAGSSPHHVGIRRRYRERADRGDR